MRKKLDSDQAKTKRNAHDDALQAMQQDLQRDNDRFINNQHTQQKQIIREQDQNLELLDQGLTRLQERSKVTHKPTSKYTHLMCCHHNDCLNIISSAVLYLKGNQCGDQGAGCTSRRSEERRR